MPRERKTLHHTDSYHVVYWPAMPPEAPSPTYTVRWHRHDPHHPRITRPTLKQAIAAAERVLLQQKAGTHE